MKKYLLLFFIFLTSCASLPKNNHIDIVNSNTVIFKDVSRIEIIACGKCEDQLTYIYDLNKSEIVRISKGSFVCDSLQGDYLVQSNKPITRSEYKINIEYSSIY